jgi:hypothetical protein
MSLDPRYCPTAEAAETVGIEFCNIYNNTKVQLLASIICVPSSAAVGFKLAHYLFHKPVS